MQETPECSTEFAKMSLLGEYATTDTEEDDDDSVHRRKSARGLDAPVHARASVLRQRRRSGYAGLPLKLSASASCSLSSLSGRIQI
jgi:hypothetical protein